MFSKKSRIADHPLRAQELLFYSGTSSLDPAFQNAEVSVAYEGPGDTIAGNFEPRGEPAPGDAAGLLSRQIQQLLGKDCEIDSGFFEIVWRSGLQSAIEDFAVRRAGEDRASHPEGREGSSGETLSLF